MEPRRPASRPPFARVGTVCPRCGSASAPPFAAGSVCLRCAGARVLAFESHAAPLSVLPSADGAPSAPTDGQVQDLAGGADLPERIGDYEIIEELGRGGMGRVFAARQIGLGRIVALKTIPAGRGAADVELRFLREAQTIARLRHPHIVAVHDSGRAHGHVYFTMDYVEGGDLARRLRERPYAPREAAELLGKVAAALAYTHGEGVLHRDLKPSNILLDGEEPRVADFGLAAQLEAGGDLTAATGVLGTPHYLAPEALRGGSAALTVASDLYALGVILFELLTGRTPFPGTSPAGLAAIVENTEPPAPRLLAPAVPRDLETICLKCLERDPARRYAGAAALGEDLRRFLAEEPILARPPGAWDALGKFTRRHRAAVGAGAASAIILLAATAASTALALRARRAERRAAHEAAAANAVVAFLKDDLLAFAAPLPEQPDPEVKLRTVLDRAAQTIARRFAEQPQIEAPIREMLGVTYGGLGDYPLMHQHLARAHAVALQQYGADDPRTIEVAGHLGAALNNLGRNDEAEAWKTRLLAQCRRIFGEEDPRTLRALNDVGVIWMQQGKLAAAEPLIARALAAQERILGPEHFDTLATCCNLGMVLNDLGRFGEAENVYERGLERARRVLGVGHGLTTTLMNNVGWVYVAQGRLDRAEALLLEVVAVRQKNFGPEHPFTLSALNSIGVVYRNQKRLAEAEALLSRVLETRRRLFGAENRQTLASENALAATYRELGKLDEACALYLRALDARTRVLGPEHPDTLRTMHALALTYAAQGRRAEAAALHARAAELRGQVLGAAHPETLAAQAAARALENGPREAAGAK